MWVPVYCKLKRWCGEFQIKRPHLVLDEVRDILRGNTGVYNYTARPTVVERAVLLSLVFDSTDPLFLIREERKLVKTVFQA